MSITTSEMTPADIRACTCGNDGGGVWGGDWFAYLLLFALFGGGGFGFGGLGGGGILPWLLFANGGLGGFGNGAPVTQADLAMGFNNSAVLSGINGIDSALCQGFNGINTAILQGNNALSAQLAQCCCDNRAAIADVKYTIANEGCETRHALFNNTRDIIDNANANSRAILDFLTNDKIATLTAENQSLKFQASQTAQNAYIGATVDAAVAELIRRTGRDCPQPAFLVNGPTPINFPVNACGQVQFGGNSAPCSGF